MKKVIIGIIMMFACLSLVSAITWRTGGTDMMSLDNSGNLTVEGNVTAKDNIFVDTIRSFINSIVEFVSDVLISGDLNVTGDIIADGTVTAGNFITSGDIKAVIGNFTNITIGDPVNLYEEDGELVISNSTKVFGDLNVTGNIFGDGSQLTDVSTFNSTYDAKADYQFGSNNFNGSGNISTLGDGEFKGDLSVTLTASSVVSASVSSVVFSAGRWLLTVNEDIIPVPIPDPISESDGYKMTFTSGALNGQKFSIVDVASLFSDKLITDQNISAAVNGDTLDVTIETAGVFSVAGDSEFLGTTTLNKLKSDKINSTNGLGITVDDDLNLGSNDIDVANIFASSGEIDSLSALNFEINQTRVQFLLSPLDALSSFSSMLDLTISGNTLTNKHMIFISGDTSTSGGGAVTNDFGIRILGHSSSASNEYGMVLESDDAGWGAFWWGSGRDAKEWFDGSNLNIDPTITSPTAKLNVLSSLNVTGNYSNNANIGITGNFTNGNCWTAYSGGIVYGTNCTSM